MKHLLLIQLFFIALGLQAQQNSIAAGGEANGQEGTISYTVGQTIYTFKSDAGGTNYDGIQQAYQVFENLGSKAIRDLLNIDVYPNPATDKVHLRVGEIKNTSLIFYLYDLNGKQLESEKVVDIETIISMDHFSSGSYFLKVNNDGREVAVFKILKNN
jgi:hypothetical protein